MNFKLKLFTITAFATCMLILPPTGSVYAVDENVSGEKIPVSIDNEETEVVSVTEKDNKRMEEQERKELLNKIESRISANNKSYRLIYMGIFFAVLIYAFLTLRCKEDILVLKQNGMNSKKE